MIYFEGMTAWVMIIGVFLVGMVAGTLVQAYNIAVVLHRSGLEWVGDCIQAIEPDQPAEVEHD